MPTSAPRPTLHRSILALLGAVALATTWVVPAAADHDGVTAVTGSAFGVHAYNISLFGSPQPDNGPTPTVTLPAGGGSVSDSDPDGHTVAYGPATLFVSGALTVSSTGTLGADGSVTSSANVVGDAEGVDPFRWEDLTSTCAADASGATGSTTIVGGTVTSTTGTTTVPTNPAPNHTVEGVVPGANDDFRIVFNEQTTGTDGTLTVNAAHLYLLGPTARGDLVIGQSVCGVTVTDANHPPVANDDAYSTDFETALSVPAPGVLANDTDPDGDPLTAGMPTGPASGTLTLNADGSFTYTPDAGFSGDDTFTYMAHDPDNAMDTATVTVTVGAAPAPPPPPPPPGEDEADLSVTIVGAPDPARAGSLLTYTVTVENEGPGHAGAMVFVTKPRGAKYLSATGADCVGLRGRIKGVVCDLGTVAPGATASVDILLRAPGRPAPVLVFAAVWSATPDPDHSDNLTWAVTTVERRRSHPFR
ncbi:MAG: Ig-like domain-containing protein [Acidimicrobiales bacterium]